MNTQKYILASAFVLCLSLMGFAQTEPDTTRVLTEEQTEAQSQLGSEELEVIKAFKAKLATASSLSINPTIEAAQPVNRDYDYRISIVPYDINYADPTIKPFAMKPDAKKEYKKGYAKLGFGNFLSPLADASYHNTTGKVEYGLMANYFSLDNSDQNAYQKMSDIDVNAHANIKLTDNLEILTGIYTAIDQRYFFHIPENEVSDFSEEAAKRNLNTYGAKVGIKNGSNYALQYQLGVDANYMSISNDDTNNDESYIFPIGELLVDAYSDKLQISLGVDQEYIHNNIQNVASYNPYYQARQGDYGSTITQSYYGGAQGQWSKLSYRGKVGYRQIENQAILVNAEDVRKFNLGYIDMNTVFIEANASYELNDRFTIGGSFQQNIFDLADDVVAFHLPSMRYNAYTVIHLLDDNLTIRPSIAFTDRVEYITEGAIEQKIYSQITTQSIMDMMT